MTTVTRTNDRLARALLLTEGPAMTEETPPPPKPEFGTSEYLHMQIDQYLDRQLDRGVAIGYVYGRYDLGGGRLSLADAWGFVERFLAIGGNWTELGALYEQFAAEQDGQR